MNWEAVAKSLFERVYRESVGRVVDETTKALLSALLAYPDVKTDWQSPQSLNVMPFIPLSFVKDSNVLHYFSMVTTVGTPQTIAAQELRLECMFPADEATEGHHSSLMGNVAAKQMDAHLDIEE